MVKSNSESESTRSKSIQVMINYFIEMLEVPNFGHMTTSTI